MKGIGFGKFNRFYWLIFLSGLFKILIMKSWVVGLSPNIISRILFILYMK